jgi:hypothetical protein
VRRLAEVQGDVARAAAEIQNALLRTALSQVKQASLPEAMQPEALQVVDEIIARSDGREQGLHFGAALFTGSIVLIGHRC